VSRVGSAAQTKSMKQVAASLKLELAQYREVAAFAQFGSDLDAATQYLLNRGSRLTEVYQLFFCFCFVFYSLNNLPLFLLYQLLKQPQYKPLPNEHIVAILFSGVRGYLDKLDQTKILEFEAQLIPYLTANHSEILETIKKEEAISKPIEAKLHDALKTFVANFQ